MHKYLLQMWREFKELCGEEPCWMWAYADDINFAGPEEACVEFMDRLQELTADFRVAGLEFVPRKCKLLSHTARPPGPEGSYRVYHDCTTLLGVPVGTPEGRRAELRAQMDDMLKDADRLHELDAQTGTLLLKHCINARPSYLCRVLEPEPEPPVNEDIFSPMQAILADCDFRVTTALCQLAKYSVRTDPEFKRIHVIRIVSEDLGGLGITSFTGPDVDKGLEQSRDFLDKYLVDYVSTQYNFIYRFTHVKTHIEP